MSTAEGKKVDKAYAQKLLKEQTDELASKAPKGNKYHLAAQYFAGQVTGEYVEAFHCQMTLVLTSLKGLCRLSHKFALQ